MMPQLARGGKWVFGWSVIGRRRELLIPPAAYLEYGFQAYERVRFLSGSRTSGGFSIYREARMAEAAVPLEKMALADGVIGEDGRVQLPPEIGVEPGQRLLAVRGSGRALGFIGRGPIYIEAQRHPELETFFARKAPGREGG